MFSNLRSLIFKLDPETAHSLAIKSLKFNFVPNTLNEDKKTLTNVADTPELCDFYLSSIVSRGDLKIAISTNGKSPILGKRIRQYLEDALPNNTQKVIEGLHEFRNSLKGDFQSKVEALNEVTKKLNDRID